MKHFLAEIVTDALTAEAEQPAFAEKVQADKETIQYLGILWHPGRIVGTGHVVSKGQGDDDDLHLVGDIRLFNKQEIRQKLSATGLVESSETDSALLLQSYRQWGRECLKYLAGEFAFIIIDRKNDQVFAARDHIGARQLYYRNGPEGILALSSSIRLVMGGQVRRSDQVNMGYLLDYLLGIIADQEQTVFSAIHQVPPGHFLQFSGKTVAIERYWAPKIAYFQKSFTKNYFKEKFLSLLATVLRERWDESAHNALLLSGGLDSTSLLCLLRHTLPTAKERLAIFSNIPTPAGEEDDETDRKYIEIALKHLNVTAHYSREPVNPFDEHDLFNYYESQFRMPWHPFVVPVWPLERLLQEHGVNAIISGMGGDEIVSVEPGKKYLLLFFTGRFVSLYKELQGNARARGRTLFKSIFHELFFPLLPEGIKLLYKRLRGHSTETVVDACFLAEKTFSRKDLQKHFIKRRGNVRDDISIDPRIEIRYAVLSGYFVPLLEHGAVIAARMNCHFNMPFLDKRIIEFCLSVPAKEYVQPGMTRSFLRSSMQEMLPPQIYRRESKTLMGDTEDQSVVTNRGAIANILALDNDYVWKILDKPRLLATYNDLIAGRIVNARKRQFLARQLCRCNNVAAFLHWVSEKQQQEPGLS